MSIVEDFDTNIVEHANIMPSYGTKLFYYTVGLFYFR